MGRSPTRACLVARAGSPLRHRRRRRQGERRFAVAATVSSHGAVLEEEGGVERARHGHGPAVGSHLVARSVHGGRAGDVRPDSSRRDRRAADAALCIRIVEGAAGGRERAEGRRGQRRGHPGAAALRAHRLARAARDRHLTPRLADDGGRQAHVEAAAVRANRAVNAPAPSSTVWGMPVPLSTPSTSAAVELPTTHALAYAGSVLGPTSIATY